MNFSSEYGVGEMRLPAGHLVWDESGRVTSLNNDGHPAGAGDGLASDIVTAIARETPPASAYPPPRIRRDADTEVASGAERALGTEVDMTNWNVVVDDRVIVKVTGRLGQGDRAARLVRAITRHDPDLVPTLHGTLEIASLTGFTVIASVTELIPTATDGWSWAVGDALAHLEGSSRPSWPGAVGTLLARVHGALQHETSTPEIRGTRVEGKGASTEDPRRSLRSLMGSESHPARRLRARSAFIQELLVSLPPATTPTFSVHGDFHVGQILRDAAGRYTVIDFDGDPQGGNADSADAAVDVAHILVSVDMVAAVVAKRLGRDDPRILEWSTAAQDELLAAYRVEADRRGTRELLDDSRLPGLMAAQLIRELTYARDFLPRWEYAADWAITHRYPPAHDQEDPPWTPPTSSTT